MKDLTPQESEALAADCPTVDQLVGYAKAWAAANIIASCFAEIEEALAEIKAQDSKFRKNAYWHFTEARDHFEKVSQAIDIGHATTWNELVLQVNKK